MLLLLLISCALAEAADGALCGAECGGFPAADESAGGGAQSFAISAAIAHPGTGCAAAIEAAAVAARAGSSAPEAAGNHRHGNFPNSTKSSRGKFKHFILNLLDGEGDSHPAAGEHSRSSTTTTTTTDRVHDEAPRSAASKPDEHIFGQRTQSEHGGSVLECDGGCRAASV